MTILVMLLLVVVSYRSCITASIAGCIACIVKDVSRDILLISADSALIPVIYFVIFLLVAVGYASCITASVAGCIA